MVTSAEILQATEAGRVLTVFCDDVHLTRQHVRLASEEQDPVPTLVGLEWEQAPALTHEIEEIRDALADAAYSLWPSWYTTAAERFDGAEATMANSGVAPPDVSSVSTRVSGSWLGPAWQLCRDQKLPIVEPTATAIQVQQLALALDPARLICILSVTSEVATSARIQGVARAAEWLAHEAKTKTLLLLPRSWQGYTELDHVTYGAVTYHATSADTISTPGVTPVVDQESKTQASALPGAATASANIEHEVTRTHPTTQPLDAHGVKTTNTSSAPFLRTKLEAPWVSVGPICGKPHPKSQVEMLVYQCVQGDAALVDMFECNQPLLGFDDKSYLVDLVWRQGKLVVELDGPEHHSQIMYVKDRQRDYSLMMNGYTVLRIANAEVHVQVDQVVEKIRNVVRFISNKTKGRLKRGK